MLRRLNEVLILVCVLTLGACATLPGNGSTQQQAAMSDADAQFAQALELIEAGDDEAAAKILLTLSDQASHLAGPWVNLSLVELRAGNNDQARTLAQEALERNPKQTDAWNVLGIVAREAGDFSAAEEAWQQVLLIDADHHDAHYNLGTLYDLYLNRPAEALAHYRHVQSADEGADRRMKAWMAALERGVERNATAQVSEE